MHDARCMMHGDDDDDDDDDDDHDDGWLMADG